jgi:hypothetical protein
MSYPAAIIFVLFGKLRVNVATVAFILPAGSGKVAADNDITQVLIYPIKENIRQTLWPSGNPNPY